jgi:nucleobase transporter 1/2
MIFNGSIAFTAEAIFLGFQHYLVMLGSIVIISTILVPLMGGGNVSTFSFLFFVLNL